jgi:hypothetical protein
LRVVSPRHRDDSAGCRLIRLSLRPPALWLRPARRCPQAHREPTS